MELFLSSGLSLGAFRNKLRLVIQGLRVLHCVKYVGTGVRFLGLNLKLSDILFSVST